MTFRTAKGAWNKAPGALMMKILHEQEESAYRVHIVKLQILQASEPGFGGENAVC